MTIPETGMLPEPRKPEGRCADILDELKADIAAIDRALKLADRAGAATLADLRLVRAGLDHGRSTAWVCATRTQGIA